MPINDLPIKDLPTNNNQVFNGEAQTNQANGSPVSYPSLDLEIAKALENAAKAQLELAQLIEKMRNLYHSK